ncbi:MAG: DUF4835 family protein [Bacteroidetes bacterium]|nr:DUF4835 family protein [Bacteroidota bacterium]
MKRILLILFLSAAHFNLSAQELNCQVSINSDQIQGSVNKQIFEQLKSAIMEFMNNTKWTSEIYAPNEKIECSLFLTISQSSGSDSYSGKIQVQSRRPVFKSSYHTQAINYEDEYLQFKFQQFTQLQFNLNVFNDNLTSILAYYAYVIIAADNDTFSSLGGTPYWQKAQVVAQNAQSSGDAGWDPSKSQKNRYWLIENTLQPVFKGIRECMYQYSHALDIMNQDVEGGRAELLKSLDLLKPVYTARPASFPMQLFFNAKRDELINIFKGGLPEEKNKAMEVLTMVDPAGTTKYTKILE